MIKFFDCFAAFGRSSVPGPRQASTAAELVSEMEFCQVSEALVYHTAQREDNPMVGNGLVLDECKGYPNLHPTWSILPSQTGEMPEPQELFRKMKASGVKALWAFPREHKYLLDSTTFGPLFNEMSERKIPLLIRTGGEDWARVSALLREFPKLTLLAVGHGRWGEDRYFRPLLDRYPNLFVDTSSYELDGGIADLCKCYGPSRLVFGTGYPEICMGGAMMTLLHAEIPEKYKESIGGDNLREILGGAILD